MNSIAYCEGLFPLFPLFPFFGDMGHLRSEAPYLMTISLKLGRNGKDGNNVEAQV